MNINLGDIGIFDRLKQSFEAGRETSTHLCVLQFDEKQMALLRAKRTHKGLHVESFACRNGAWSASDGSLAEALKGFLAEYDAQDDDLYTVLPRYDMTARILDLPSHDPEEIEGMVRFGAEEYVPFPVDELDIDHCVLETREDGQSSVLAVFAHKDVVAGHMALLDKAGLTPLRVLVSSACLASIVKAAPEAFAEARDRFMLLDLASGGLEALVFEGARLAYVRAVAAHQDWTLEGDRAADAREELLLETKATLSAYRRGPGEGRGADDVYISSTAGDVTKACTTLENAINELRESHDGDPLQCRAADVAGAVVTAGADELAGFPLVLIGGALAAQDRAAYEIDLVPDRVKRLRQKAHVRTEVAKVAGAIGIVLLCLWGVYFQSVHTRQTYIDELQGKISQLNPRIEDVVEMQKQLEVLQSQVKRTDTVLELFALLCDQMPAEGMNITLFDYDRDRGIVVSGRALGRPQIERFTDNLRTIEQFKAAREMYTQTRRERTEEVMEYGIEIPFEKKAGSNSTGRSRR